MHIYVTQRFVSKVRRHICIIVTLLISYVCVQIDYQLLVHQLLLIIHMCFICVQVLYVSLVITSVISYMYIEYATLLRKRKACCKKNMSHDNGFSN